MKFRLGGDRKDNEGHDSLHKLKMLLLALDPSFRKKCYNREIQVRFHSDGKWYNLEDKLEELKED